MGDFDNFSDEDGLSDQLIGLVLGVQKREPRIKMHETRFKKQDLRNEGQETRAKKREPGNESQETRAKKQEPRNKI